jgi:hypothetical protein
LHCCSESLEWCRETTIFSFSTSRRVAPQSKRTAVHPNLNARESGRYIRSGEKEAR